MNKLPFGSTMGLGKSLVQGEVRLSVLLSSLVLILATGVLAYMASSTTFAGKAVYCSETFGRGLYYRFFQVAVSSDQHTLFVQNGDPSTGQNRVDSAVMTLNAPIIAGLRDLSAKTASIEKLVTLNKLNVLAFLISILIVLQNSGPSFLFLLVRAWARRFQKPNFDKQRVYLKKAGEC